MAFIDSATSTIQATLTRRGRELLSTNSVNFTITKFAFGDDEINYSFYDGSSPDADNSQITSLPVMEPSSEQISALRWGLITRLLGTTNVAEIEIVGIKQTNPEVFANRNVLRSILIRTLNGYDSQYFVSSTDEGIVFPTQETFESRQDTTKRDMMKSQSEAELAFGIPGGVGQSTNVIIKGFNTGATKIVKFTIVN